MLPDLTASMVVLADAVGSSSELSHVVRASFRRHDEGQRGMLPRFALDVVLAAVLLPPDAGYEGLKSSKSRRRDAELGALGKLLDNATDKATGLVNYERLLDWIFGPEEAVYQVPSRFPSVVVQYPPAAPPVTWKSGQHSPPPLVPPPSAASVSATGPPSGPPPSWAVKSVPAPQGSLVHSSNGLLPPTVFNRAPASFREGTAPAPERASLAEGGGQLSSVVETLMRAESKEARLRAAVSLESLGLNSVPAAAVLAHALSNDVCEAVRRTAALALCRMGAVAAVYSASALQNVLSQDDSADVRCWAAEALGRLTQPLRASSLVSDIANASLARALLLVAAAAAPVLEVALRSDKDPRVRSKAAVALGRFPQSDMADTFQPALLTAMEQDDDPRVRGATVRSVASISRGASVAMAMAALRRAAAGDASAMVRGQASDELARLGRGPE